MPRKFTVVKSGKYQVGFAPARVLWLPVGKGGKQQRQDRRCGFVMMLQKCGSAFSDAAGDLLQIRRLVCADLACEEKGHNER